MTLRLSLAVLGIVVVLSAFVVIHGHFFPANAVAHRRRIPRSAAARNAFRRLHPCPATGLVRGACPGYVIDHVKPLACGGADAPFNMQWQTRAEAKAKDALERKTCGE